MKKLFKCLMLLMVIFVMASCSGPNHKEDIIGSRAYITKTYEGLDGDSITIEHIQIKDENVIVPIEFYILPGDEKKITIYAQQEILDNVMVNSTLGSISILGKENCYYSTKAMKICAIGYKFSSVNLEFVNGRASNDTLADTLDLDLTNASSFAIDSFKGKQLDLSISGGSLLSVNSIDVEKLKVTESSYSTINILNSKVSEAILNITGTSVIDLLNASSKTISVEATDSSTCNINGKTNNLDLVFSGTSSYNGKGLVTEISTIIISGGSNVTLTSTKGINVVASGRSSVVYYGNGTVTETSITGKSTITRGE